MKERIHGYLMEARSGVSAAQILTDVLKIHSPNANYPNGSSPALAGEDPSDIVLAGLLEACGQLQFRLSKISHSR